MIRNLMLISVLIIVAACGNKGELRPKTGQSLPVKPLYAQTTPSVNQLLTSNSQQRPQRSDDLIDRSKERRNDPYDLPPVN